MWSCKDGRHRIGRGSRILGSATELVDSELGNLPYFRRPAHHRFAVDAHGLDPDLGAMRQQAHPQPAVDRLTLDGAHEYAIDIPRPCHDALPSLVFDSGPVCLRPGVSAAEFVCCVPTISDGSPRCQTVSTTADTVVSGSRIHARPCEKKRPFSAQVSGCSQLTSGCYTVARMF